jgi:tRNA-specific 2-thiouridylase
VAVFRTVHADQLSWVSGSPPFTGSKLTAKIRYRQVDQACTVYEISPRGFVLEFDQEQRAATAGQSVVLYDGENCLGGGVISWADTPPATRSGNQTEEVNE